MRFHPARQLLLALACAAAAALPARADYPDRPIRLIAPIAAGTSALDLACRAMAEKMGPKLGTQIVVINQPGASGMLAAASIAKGPKDGYTLNLNTAAAVAYPKLLNKDLSYEPARDLTPVAVLGPVPVGLFVSGSSDIRTLQDFVAAAKARPNTLNYATPGIGTVSHLAAEMLLARTDTKARHVPYGASLSYWTDLAAGRLDAVVGGVTGGLPLVQDGRLRLVAVLGRNRAGLAPDVPAAGETLPDFDVPSWLGLVVAQGTPEAVIDKLEAAALESFADPEFKAAMLRVGIDVAPLGRKAFAAMLAKELPKWEQTLRAAGVGAGEK